MEIMNSPFMGTAFFATLTYVGYQLRAFPTTIWEQIKKRIIYSAHIEESSELFTYFEKWLTKYHEGSFKNVKASLTTDNNKHESDEVSHEEDLNLQHYSDIFILKYKGKRLVINKGREKFENASELRNAFYNNFKIEGWFAKDKITELFIEVIKYNKTLKKVKQTIYTNSDYGDWINFGEIYGKSIDNIVLKEKSNIVDNIKDFISKEDWYFQRGLSYKRGYLFYGSPGNGKTSLCLALAKEFNKDIQFLNLNDFEKDSNLFRAFNNIRNNSILVIEDVDAIMGNREGESKISFSALLNCMDGAFSKYGIITIMTTNHIKKIDAALIREGRIDMKINIDNPDTDMVEEYLSIFYGKKAMLGEYKNMFSMSKIQEICLLHKDDMQSACNELTKIHKTISVLN